MKKLIFLPVLFTAFILNSCNKEENEPIKNSENVEHFEISSWNMDENKISAIKINNSNEVISIDVLIIDDNGNKSSLFCCGNYIIENDIVFIYRNDDGYFDQPVFSNSSMNRGIITIHYSN